MQIRQSCTPDPVRNWTSDSVRAVRNPRNIGNPRNTNPLVRITVILTLFAAALGVHFVFIPGAASAAPRAVGYDLSVSSRAVELQLRSGGASVDHGQLSIRNDAGTELGRVPLGYRMENRWYPIDAHIVGKRVTLIPSRNAARSQPVNPLEVQAVRAVARHQVAEKPRSKQERDQIALRQFNDQVRAGMTISSLVGMAVGAVVGGAIGCLLGLTAVVVGCLVGVAPAAAIGGIVGTIIGGGGNAIVAGIQYFQTINSPFPG